MAWFQVLPVNCKSSLPFQFNCVHILPEAKIPYELPIEFMLKIHEGNERKIERRSIVSETKQQSEDREQFEMNAKSQGLIVLPDFDFKHVIYKLTEQNLSSEGLLYSYTKCAVFLGLKDEEHAGVTCVLTPKWMMVSQIDKPYMESPEKFPCFLDGFAYTGLVQLQQVEMVWPKTTGQSAEQKKVFESMKAQGQSIC